jgi:hypothetical protein
MSPDDALAQKLLRMIFSPLSSRGDRKRFVGRMRQLEARGSQYAQISLRYLPLPMPDLFPGQG